MNNLQRGFSEWLKAVWLVLLWGYVLASAGVLYQLSTKEFPVLVQGTKRVCDQKSCATILYFTQMPARVLMYPGHENKIVQQPKIEQREIAE